MDETFTYEQLNHALLELGFEKRVTEQYTLYSKAGTHALVALPPNIAPEMPVSFWHWGAARSAVVEHGIATLSEFTNALRQSVSEGKTHNATANGIATSVGTKSVSSVTG